MYLIDTLIMSSTTSLQGFIDSLTTAPTDTSNSSDIPINEIITNTVSYDLTKTPQKRSPRATLWAQVELMSTQPIGPNNVRSFLIDRLRSYENKPKKQKYC